MSDDKDNLRLLPEAQKQLDKIAEEHEGAGEAIRELFACMRQAHHAWKSGQYNSFEDAMEAITGERPKRVQGGKTERERICLEYLSDKMEASARMIGEVLIAQLGITTRHYPSNIGRGALAALHRRGLVTCIPEHAAWRITAAGREALAALKGAGAEPRDG